MASLTTNAVNGNSPRVSEWDNAEQLAAQNAAKPVAKKPVQIADASTFGAQGSATMNPPPAVPATAGALTQPNTQSSNQESITGAATGLRAADEESKPGILNYLAAAVDLFGRAVSPLFNLMMLSIRVAKWTWQILKGLGSAIFGSGQEGMIARFKSGATDNNTFQWDASIMRALAKDVVGIMFPPATLLTGPAVDYYLDKRGDGRVPGDSFAGLFDGYGNDTRAPSAVAIDWVVDLFKGSASSFGLGTKPPANDANGAPVAENPESRLESFPYVDGVQPTTLAPAQPYEFDVDKVMNLP